MARRSLGEETALYIEARERLRAGATVEAPLHEVL